jgi:hypothetical protein
MLCKRALDLNEKETGRELTSTSLNAVDDELKTLIFTFMNLEKANSIGAQCYQNVLVYRISNTIKRLSQEEAANDPEKRKKIESRMFRDIIREYTAGNLI